MFRLSFISHLQVVTLDISIYNWHCFYVRDVVYVNSSMLFYVLFYVLYPSILEFM